MLGASASCGGGGTATPVMTAVATQSPSTSSTVAATVIATAPAATQRDFSAPISTVAPQPTSAPAAHPPVSPPPPTTAPPPPPSPPAEQSLTIVAKDVKFSPSSLTARAGSVLHLTLDNQDAGVPHDIVLYGVSGAIAGATEPTNGPVRQTLTVTLGAPQRYAFKCSVHPRTMNGTLVAQ